MALPYQRMFDSFMLIAGIIIGAVVGFAILMLMAQMGRHDVIDRDDPAEQQAIMERIRPLGQVALVGDPELDAMPAVAEAPARPQTRLSGPQVYNEACFVCHSPPGVGGAPVTGDAMQWADRIAQGIDVLAMHAIEGYQGDAGYMPPKGGRPDLSDEEVTDAVEYMVEQVP